jgi:hypothetical protein
MTRERVVAGASMLALVGLYACRHLSTAGVPQNEAVRSQPNSFTDDIEGSAAAMLKDGRNVFRHETFGDEFFWGDTLQLHLVELGHKVDVDHLNRILGAAVRGGSASLD